MTDIPLSPIEVTPQQRAYYDKLLPQISAITDYVVPKIPPEEIVGEANRVNALIKEDRARLERSGIELHYLDSFEERAGAMSWAAADMVTYINMETTAKKEWDGLQPEADEVRRKLLKTLKRAFRKKKDLYEAVERIMDGSSNLDQVLDFLSMSKLAQENKEMLEEVFADLSLIDRASELHTKLSNILSRMVTDPKKLDQAKVTFYKAWTYLNEALKEVYEAGQYAFDEDDSRHSLYYNDYHVRLGKASAKAKRSQDSAKEAENSKKDTEVVGA